MSKTATVLFVFIVSAFAITSSAQPNVLVNGNFELNPPPGCGNHYPWPIAPWVLGTGSQANVVTVDGPGGCNYGNNGPESDASAPGAGIAQHYLDIANGENDFYQSFTPRCSGSIRFGGYFSTRGNVGGTATVTIRDGVGLTGAIIGATNNVALPNGNSQLDPWTLVSYSVPVTAFHTYSFVVHMTNNLNLDNAFVRYETDCPLPDPCCPPWNTSLLREMLVYSGTAGINAPYTLKFQPALAFSNQMQAYINYLNMLNPTFTAITIQFRLHDAGTGATPVTGAQMGVSHYVTWTAGGSGPTPVPTFFSGPPETMVVNHWYVVHTGIYLENGQKYFSDKCANNDVAVRVQVLGLAKSQTAKVQFRTPEGRIIEKPVQ